MADIYVGRYVKKQKVSKKHFNYFISLGFYLKTDAKILVVEKISPPGQRKNKFFF